MAASTLGVARSTASDRSHLQPAQMLSANQDLLGQDSLEQDQQDPLEQDQQDPLEQD